MSPCRTGSSPSAGRFPVSTCRTPDERADSAVGLLRSGCEPLRLERGRIDERRGAGHQIRQQPAGDGAEGEPQVMVAEIEPEAGLARERSDDRAHVRQAGAPAHPWRGVLALADGEELARELLDPVEMGGGG